MGRFIPRETSRRKIYEGAFLGICAAVAFVTVVRGNWLTTLAEWGNPIRSLGKFIYYIIVRPVDFVTSWIPEYFILLISGPIGAAIGYNTSPHEEQKPETVVSDEESAEVEHKKRRR
jgi:hypothetical protein